MDTGSAACWPASSGIAGGGASENIESSVERAGAGASPTLDTDSVSSVVSGNDGNPDAAAVMTLPVSIASTDAATAASATVTGGGKVTGEGTTTGASHALPSPGKADVMDGVDTGMAGRPVPHASQFASSGALSKVHRGQDQGRR